MQPAYKIASDTPKVQSLGALDPEPMKEGWMPVDSVQAAVSSFDVCEVQNLKTRIRERSESGPHLGREVSSFVN